MVVDDSAVIRGLITRILEGQPDIRVAASANNGQVALDRLRALTIHVIVLDIEMPVMDGLTAVPLLLEIAPDVRIIIASTLSTPGADVTLRALRLGAADYVPKPTASRDIVNGAPVAEAFRSDLIAKVRALGRPKLARPSADPAPSAGMLALAGRPAAPQAQPAAVALRPLGRKRADVLAIGSSTGGPQALFQFFNRLRPDFRLPILVTQHMPPKFTTILAEHIARSSGRDCREAENGEPLAQRRIYVAPGEFHMVVDSSAGTPVIRLNQDPPENFCRPAVDPLFRSLAKVYGDRALALVLTGMGSDGLKGGDVLVKAGGTLAAQDEKTSVVWGMPGAVARAGLCSLVTSVDSLADFVNGLMDTQG
jgi:two-component system chemotaxis response regulator CheB